MATVRPPAVRPPAVAGMFYPSDPEELARDVDRMLDHVRACRARPAGGVEAGGAEARGDEAGARRGAGPLRAVVAPHAGYVYSGPTAAHAYDAIAAEAEQFDRVILLGPTHRVAVVGLALPGARALATPLGDVEVDHAAAARAAELAHVTTSAHVHEFEHSLEVQLPFLQAVLPGRPVLPLAVGRASAAEVADVLGQLLDDPVGADALVVVSSDLSHYLPYDTAREVDEATIHQVLTLDPHIDHTQACGATPLIGLLELARRRGWTPTLLDIRNSGDTAGDRNRVVGYAALAFRVRAGSDGSDDDTVAATNGAATKDTATKDTATNKAGTNDTAASDKAPDAPALAALPTFAREVIRAHLAGRPAPAAPLSGSAKVLREPGAAFVTLSRADGSLRGCIGSLTAHRPLGEDVAAHAVDAAVADPRFPPVTAEELDSLAIEVSVLGTPEPLASGDVSTREEAIALLRPGVDGVILRAGPYRSTFLPRVWDQRPDPRAFLDDLGRKAGLPSGYWGPEVELQRYRATEYHETPRHHESGRGS